MEKKMTEGKEWKQILMFTLPMMGAGILQFLYATVDSVILGNFVGATALGAVGISGPMIWLLNGINSGAGMGTSIVLSRYYGAGDDRAVHDHARSALVLYALFGFLLMGLYFLLAEPVLLGFMKAPEEMQAMTLSYYEIYCIGIVPQLLYNVIYGILRAHGDSRSSLLFLVVAAILNTVLDLLFVVVFQMGVAGAALATILAQTGSAVASLIYMVRKYENLRIRRSEWHLPWLEVKQNLRMSLPIMFQGSVTCVGFIVLQRLVNSFGAPSIEGFAALDKAENIAWIPMNCFGGALAAFVGQNIGAGRTDRVRTGFQSAIWLILASSTILGSFLYLAGTPLLELFNLSGDAMIRAREHMDLVAIFLFLVGFNNAAAGLMQGAGWVMFPTIASAANLGLRLLLAYLMAGTAIDYRCIYYSLPPAWAFTALIYVFGYLHLKKKLHTMP